MIAEIRLYSENVVHVGIYTSEEIIEPFFSFSTNVAMEESIFMVLKAHNVTRVKLLDDNLPITYTSLAMYFAKE